MKEWAARLYKSKAWKACRDGYLKRAGGLCEECLSRGIWRPAEIVHHIVEVTPENIDDPRVALNWENLQAVCRECHAEKHGARQRRYTVDEVGRVSARR